MNRSQIPVSDIEHIGFTSLESLIDYYTQNPEFTQSLSTLVITPYVRQQLRSRQDIATYLYTDKHDDGLFVVLSGLDTEFAVTDDNQIHFWFESDDVNDILSEEYSHPTPESLENNFDARREENHILPYEELYASFEDEFGNDAAADFFSAIDTFDPKNNGDRTLNTTYILPMVAARHELFGHDVTAWAEETGFVTSGTFSNKKNELIEANFIDKHKVLFDNGRPRHQLTLPRGVTFNSVSEMVEKYQSGFEPEPTY